MLDRADGHYANTAATGLFLDRAKPTYVGGLLEMANAPADRNARRVRLHRRRLRGLDAREIGFRSTTVHPLAEIPDMAAFAEFMQTQAAAEAMKHDGVRPATIVVLGEG